MSDCPRCLTPLPRKARSCPRCPPDYNHELQERLARALEGRYEIVRLLGRGGMAAVFLAQDLDLERQVAIKVLPPDATGDDRQLIARFQQEAKTAARLDHPSIIPIHRVESEAGLVYIVMKYVSGQSLEDLLARGRLPIPRVRQVLREAALALGHAHRRHIVHRDVKPANIMLEDDGRLVLTDFGIAKALQGATSITGTGAIVGTPHYMSPEQAKGRRVDGRTDQYALAIVGYRALTGKLPFEGDAPSILYQQVFEPPPSLLDRRSDTPADLRWALDRALSKDAKDRFPNMEEFAAAVSGERPASGSSGTTTVVSPRATTSGQSRPVGDLGSGLFVAMGTVAAVIAAALIALPKLQNGTDRRPAVISRPSAAARVNSHAPLTVRSHPRGILYIDGVKVGLTPVSNYRLAPGAHLLRVELKGYRPVAERIVVKGAGPIQRRYDLRRQATR